MSETGGAFLDLFATASLIGRYRYVELSLAALTGARAAAGTPPLASFLSGASGAHSWRAGLFEERLPVSAGLPDAGACTASPGPALERALDVLGTCEEAALVASLVEDLYPAMLASWRAHAAAASPLADAPVLRMLRRTSDDLAAVRAEGAALLAATSFTGAASRPALGELLAEDGPFGRLFASSPAPRDA